MNKIISLASAAAFALAIGMAPAMAQTAAAPAATTQAAPAAKKPPTAKQQAARDRMKRCGAEWKQVKAKGTTMTWREFSSQCLKKKS